VFDLAGKTAVIVGGATGIGARCAEVFAEAGAAVVIGDIAVDAGQAQCDKLRATGAQAEFVRTDVSEPADVEDLMETAVQRFGTLDVVHNNVAALGMFDVDHAVADIDVDVWDRIMRINLRGIMLGCKYAVPRMIASGGGSIVNTSSSRAFGAAVDWPAYGTSKLGVIGLTRYVATAYGKQGVRCNAIAPGVILTGAAAATLGPDRLAAMLKHYLTTRLGTPDDVAKCALFLASDASSFITGQVISVDGGLGAHQPYYGDEMAPPTMSAT